MVSLLGIDDAASGEKRAAQEARAAAVVLEHAEIDMVGKIVLLPEGGADGKKLFRIGDKKGPLPSRPFRRHTVEAQAERSAEQTGQPLREPFSRRDHADLAPVEGMAVEQHSVSLGQSAAGPAQTDAAELVFGF